MYNPPNINTKWFSPKRSTEFAWQVNAMVDLKQEQGFDQGSGVKQQL